MKKIFLTPILVLAISAIAQTANAQGFPYQDYKTRDLSELAAIDSALLKSDTSYQIIQAKPFYSAIRVEYTGKSRAISSEKMNLFKNWQGTIGVDAKVLTLLKNEYLFRECDKEYWIPVQKQVAAFFPKELKNGDKITLYLMAVGVVILKGEWNSVFLVNEFKK
jgi:hypothetical protein